VPSTVEKLSPSRVKLTIEIPFADLKPHLDKAYRQIAGQVNVPGFRKGKVPQAIIDQRFGRGAVLQEAINEALPDAYGQAVAESELVPLGQPDIDITRLEDGELVEFTAELDVRPDFDVPPFDSLSAQVAPLEATDDQVEERINLMRQRFATREDVDRPAAEGDVVTIDLVASRDGEEVEDGSASGLTYKIGTGGMLDGLDEAVTGLSAGESAEFTSELVGGPAMGEQAEIRVTVTKVQAETLPEVDDEFAQMVSEFDTVDEMRADLADAVVRMARLAQLDAARDALLADLVARTDLELPEKLLAAELEGRREQINDQLARAGYTLERYLEDNAEEAAGTPEEFWAQVEENATTSLSAQIILDKLADEHEVGVDQSELTQMLFRRAQANGTSPEQEMQHMLEHNHANEWMAEIRRGKVLGLIVAQASITDTDGNVIDVAAVGSDGSIVVPEEAGSATQDEPKKAGKKAKKAGKKAAEAEAGAAAAAAADAPEEVSAAD